MTVSVGEPDADQVIDALIEVVAVGVIVPEAVSERLEDCVCVGEPDAVRLPVGDMLEDELMVPVRENCR